MSLPFFGAVARACRAEVASRATIAPGLVWEFTIPVRTRSESNMREPWMARAGRQKAHRQATSWVMRGLRSQLAAARTWPGWSVHLVRLGKAALDEGDNLNGSMKAVRDQVALELGCAKVNRRGKAVSNDSDPRLSFTYGQEVDRKGGYAVRVRVERRGDA